MAKERQQKFNQDLLNKLIKTRANKFIDLFVTNWVTHIDLKSKPLSGKNTDIDEGEVLKISGVIESIAPNTHMGVVMIIKDRFAIKTTISNIQKFEIRGMKKMVDEFYKVNSVTGMDRTIAQISCRGGNYIIK